VRGLDPAGIHHTPPQACSQPRKRNIAHRRRQNATLALQTDLLTWFCVRLRRQGSLTGGLPGLHARRRASMRASGCTTDQRIPRRRATTAVVVFSEPPDAPSACRSRRRTAACRKGSGVVVGTWSVRRPGTGRRPVDYDDRHPAAAGPLATTTSRPQTRTVPASTDPLATHRTHCLRCPNGAME
jgi:hypothetical protein